MPLDPKLQRYVGIASAIVDFVGIAIPIVGQLRQVIALLAPNDTLTDAEINAIEAAGVADSTRRKAEREDMGRPG